MQALTYHGRKDVRVETVPDPVLAADEAAARKALESNGWVIRQAVSTLTGKA